MPGLQTLMVAEDDTNSLMEITRTGALLQNHSVAALSAGSGLFVDPDGIAVDFETNRMFVSNKGDNNGNVMVFNLTPPLLLGDVNGAMTIARRLVAPGEVFEMDLLYSPEFRMLREHPEFMPLLERLGVVRYWDEAGCSFDGNKAVCDSD